MKFICLYSGAEWHESEASERHKTETTPKQMGPRLSLKQNRSIVKEITNNKPHQLTQTKPLEPKWWPSMDLAQIWIKTTTKHLQPNFLFFNLRTNRVLDILSSRPYRTASFVHHPHHPIITPSISSSTLHVPLQLWSPGFWIKPIGARCQQGGRAG